MFGRCVLGFVVVASIDIEEVVEDNHHHGAGAEEDGQAVEVGVGDHDEGIE